jgi:hypothetical protein
VSGETAKQEPAGYWPTGRDGSCASKLFFLIEQLGLARNIQLMPLIDGLAGLWYQKLKKTGGTWYGGRHRMKNIVRLYQNIKQLNNV